MSKPNTAAILLCAGKGTRMGNSTINKVAYECAGIPVIKRIVRNMRKGGVERFVVVVGHKSQSVMDALKDEGEILYAYQSEQKGTGHAAACGLELLESIGFKGNVIISMGDKIVASALVSKMLSLQHAGTKAVLAVENRPQGATSRGHVVIRNGKVYGIVEAKDVRRALELQQTISLGGESFQAEEIASTKFVNAAVYSFDCESLSSKLKCLNSNNAQGEFYLTDTIEVFACSGELQVYVVENSSDIQTFSTRSELRLMARAFMRPISEFTANNEIERKLFSLAKDRFGNRPVVVVSAPGRVNVMGRHIEHRGGSVNMLAIDNRMTFVVAPRQDDVVAVYNIDESYSAASFSISDFVSSPSEPPQQVSCSAAWLEFLDSPKAKEDAATNRGHWVNYIKGAVFRFQMATDLNFLGMDIIAGGDIPVAAGLSSSSAVVVCTAEAVVSLNSLNLDVRDFVDLCGEAEWYVGSRGGAGDHAAMKCSRLGYVTHLRFKPFEIGEAVKFPPGCSLLVVHSGQKAKKAEGAREIFNSRILAYERAFSDIKRTYPQLPIEHFRDLAFLSDAELEKALACVDKSDIGVARFGVAECRRAEDCLELFKSQDAAGLGRMMKKSHDGDRVGGGQYECSTVKIDELSDFLNAQDGVYGSQLVGAGLGGCVIALVESGKIDGLANILLSKGYMAFRCDPCEGSKVVF